jgi:ATP-dependent DNA helicase DinG
VVGDDEKEFVRQRMATLREGIQDFRSHRAQMQMIATVANALECRRAEDEPACSGDHVAVVDAGADTSQSFGALVPALVMAASRRKLLVASRSTVALQHRHADADVPNG